jgi:hypothetical protein
MLPGQLQEYRTSSRGVPGRHNSRPLPLERLRACGKHGEDYKRPLIANTILLVLSALFPSSYLKFVRFEVFTAVTMKNGVFWDVTPCGSCKNRSFGGT